MDFSNISKIGTLFNLSTLIQSAHLLVLLCLGYYGAFPLGRIFLNHFLLTKFWSSRRRLKRFGKWAAITGATDGIGRAYANRLAADGLNVVLLSRSPEKLADVAADIERRFKVKTRCVAVDFSRDDIYATISKELADLDVGTLVNNVGVSTPYPNYFSDPAFSDSIYSDMLRVNMLSMVMMTRILLPEMIRRGNGGAIINISSGSAVHPVPLLSVYSGTKAFADFFSRSVSYEVASRGVIVQTVLPLFVATKMSKIRRASMFVPSPESFANSALNLLGVERRTFGCTSHAVQAWAMDLVPNCLKLYLTKKIMISTRKKALAKMGKSN